MEPEIIKIQIPGLTLNARVWGPKDGKRVLAMHGWLDNAATFDLIAPRLPNLRIVSVDLPGHGFSDHLPASGHYNYIDRVIQMFQVADQLEWNTFSVMGHSMGGIVGIMMAAVAPKRIEKICLIDVFLSGTTPEETFIKQLSKYVEITGLILPHATYKTIEEAVKFRAEINPTRMLTVESAKILANGGLIKVGDGYQWTFDVRLQLPYPSVLTETQVENILKNFKTDCLLILADEGIYIGNPQMNEKIERCPNIKLVTLPGWHHLHLDTPEPVAEVISKFYSCQPFLSRKSS